MSLLINHIASGSTGNAVMVDDGYSKLLFDAGIRYNKLSKFIRPSGIEAVFITHEHSDHSKAAAELLRRGVRVFSSDGTKKFLMEKGEAVNEMEVIGHSRQVEVGSFYVRGFGVVHDAAEPLGFLFQSKVRGKGIYVADSNYIEYDFSGLTHIIIECNYSEDILEEGSDPKFLKQRIRNSHFSFEKLQEFFELTDLNECEEIHLIHLSERNSHKERFINEIQKQTGVPVYTI